MYWFPGLGYWCHLRPTDLADLDPAQLLSSGEFVTRNSGG